VRGYWAINIHSTDLPPGEFCMPNGFFGLSLNGSDVMEEKNIKRPTGELCKIQFNKIITVVGKVTFDPDTNKYHIEGKDYHSGKTINSWIGAKKVSLIEDANQREKRKYEEDKSRLN